MRYPPASRRCAARPESRLPSDGWIARAQLMTEALYIKPIPVAAKRPGELRPLAFMYVWFAVMLFCVTIFASAGGHEITGVQRLVCAIGLAAYTLLAVLTIRGIPAARIASLSWHALVLLGLGVWLVLDLQGAAPSLSTKTYFTYSVLQICHIVMWCQRGVIEWSRRPATA